MTDLLLRLPVPPSLNNIFINLKGGGRAKSGRYKAWVDEAAWATRIHMPKGWEPITLPVAVEIVVKRQRGDLDNRAKPVLDVLTRMGIWRDDSQVHDLRLRWGDIPDCQVRVSPLGATLTDLL